MSEYTHEGKSQQNEQVWTRTKIIPDHWLYRHLLFLKLNQKSEHYQKLQFPCDLKVKTIQLLYYLKQQTTLIV